MSEYELVDNSIALKMNKRKLIRNTSILYQAIDDCLGETSRLVKKKFLLNFEICLKHNAILKIYVALDLDLTSQV